MCVGEGGGKRMRGRKLVSTVVDPFQKAKAILTEFLSLKV